LLDNLTGDHSVYAQWEGNQIMFHVSTLLPYTDKNDQQLAKKRHIGNDIVVIVFQEYGSEPYVPSTIKSQYLQIQVIVKCMGKGESSRDSYYQVCVVSHSDIPRFGPPLPYPPIYHLDTKFREWLLSLLVNGELAAYNSELFRQKFKIVYRTQLEEILSTLAKKKDSRLKNFKKATGKKIKKVGEKVSAKSEKVQEKVSDGIKSVTRVVKKPNS